MISYNLSDWDMSGVLVKLGDIACKYATRYNRDIDLYGDRSIETSFQWNMFLVVCECVRAYKGFDVEYMQYPDSYKIWKISITYDFEKIGLPWEVRE